MKYWLNKNPETNEVVHQLEERSPNLQEYTSKNAVCNRKNCNLCMSLAAQKLLCSSLSVQNKNSTY
jgi:hypothetical protein